MEDSYYNISKEAQTLPYLSPATLHDLLLRTLQKVRL